MRNYIILVLISFIGSSVLYLYKAPGATEVYQSPETIQSYKNQYALGCSPNLSAINFSDSANIIPLLEGWGKHRMPVTVTNDSAAIYFQQGINMYYGFHIIEALASFEKAVQFDESFAMGHWGKALAYGPNINDFGYAASPEALAAVQKASELCSNCTPVEKALIAAMQTRYSTDTTQTRVYLNELYAAAMKEVHKNFPQSGDAAALYADALMVQHPWDLYDRLYKPKPWTPEIVLVLEQLVKQFPDHPGACHYYIHAIEGSEHPEKGLAVANRLGAMMPGLAHLVHMPSHIYIRSGYYNKGIEVNENAVKGYYQYLSQYPPVVNNAFIYIVHNLHMQASCANMAGNYTTALKISEDTKNSFDSSWLDAGGYFGMYAQYVYMTPFFTQIRFGKWDEILKTPATNSSRAYANIIWHYGRGLAYARKQQPEAAKMELQHIRDSMPSALLHESPLAFNPGIAAVQIAEKILEGVIAEENKAYPLAIRLLEEAVNKETGMLYNEPRDWPHPARQYLGYALLKAKQYAAAEKVYREDLMVNPNNVWSLTGLADALQQQKKEKEAKKVQQQAKAAFSGGAAKITGSVF